MFSLLFHENVFFPEGTEEAVLKLQRSMKNYFLSRHFEEHLNNQDTEDRSHTYFRNYVLNSLNQMISNSRVVRKPFEVELSKDYHFFKKSGWFVTKYCIRIPYDSTSDLVIVVRPQWNSKTLTFDLDRNMIVTAWINHKDDDHKTLDADKYCTRDKWNSCN